jgi:hypothetical protein
VIIIKGGSRCNGAFFAKHLLNPDHNEQVHVEEIRGLAAKNIGQAFYEMKAVASGTRCKHFFYHAHINPETDEILTPEQWDRAVDELEKRLGLEGQARFVVEHEKKGRTHRHVVWSRIDVDQMRAIRMDHDYARHQAVARQLEKEFGLRPGRSVLGPDAEKGNRPERRPKSWETFRGQKSGVNVQDLKEEVTRLWREADSAEAFTAALEERGYILARGDSRAWCIVDRNGDIHSLARRIEGVKAKDVREKLSDIDPQTVPHVKEAAEQQKERQAELVREEEDRQQALQREEEQRLQAVREEEERRLQAVKEEEEKRQEAIREEQERKASLLEEEQRLQSVREEQERKARLLEEENRRREEYKQQADRQVAQAKEMQAQKERLEAFQAELTRRAGIARQEEADRQGRYREGEIRNPHSRYGQALAKHYTPFNPYESLARSAMAEYGAFLQDRENLDRQIAQTEDPAKRRRLEMRKEIESLEYMSVTSNRIASQSEIIVGKMNSPEAIKERDRAKAYQDQASALRKEYRQMSREGAQERAEAAPENEPFREEPLKVEERKPGQPSGPEQNLETFVKGLPEKPPRRWFKQQELRANPQARKEAYKQMMDDRQRISALDRIAKDIRAKRTLNANDIRSLSREDLEGIKQHGDKHLKEIVQQREKEREKDRGLER